MGFIEKRSGSYRRCERHQRSKTLTLKADAERLVREDEVALSAARGSIRGRPR